MAEYALISSEPAEEYEGWLVRNLELLREYKPGSIAIVALPGPGHENVNALTAYYNTTFADKHVMAAAINDDATEQLIRANLDKYLQELEEEEEEDFQ